MPASCSVICVYLVPVDRIFAHRRAPGDRRRHFHTHFDRVGQQDLVGRDLDLLEPIRRELISRPFGELAITWSAGKMRQGREMFVEGADPFGGYRIEHVLFQRPVCSRTIT